MARRRARRRSRRRDPRTPRKPRRAPTVGRRMTEAVPHRRLERVRELVPAAPALDVYQFVAVDAAQRDRPDRAADTGTARERHGGQHRPPQFQLGPHVIAQHELVAAHSQTSRVWPGDRAPRRRGANVARMRPTRGARPCSPPPRAMKPGGRWSRLRERALPTACARRRPALRAPLLQPRGAVAHSFRPLEGV